MPRKRRTGKRAPLLVTQRAKQIWATNRKEMIAFTPEGNGLVCDDELAAELGVPALVMLPNVREIIAKLK